MIMAESIIVFCCLLIVPILCPLKNVKKLCFAWVALTLRKPDCSEAILVFTGLLNVDIFEKIRQAGGMEGPDRGGC